MRSIIRRQDGEVNRQGPRDQRFLATFRRGVAGVWPALVSWAISVQRIEGRDGRRVGPRRLSHAESTSFEGSSGGALYAGVTEKECAERLKRAIWRANDGCCHVEVQATCLEELPYDTFYFDEEQYEELAKKQEKEPSDE